MLPHSTRSHASNAFCSCRQVCPPHRAKLVAAPGTTQMQLGTMELTCSHLRTNVSRMEQLASRLWLSQQCRHTAVCQAAPTVFEPQVDGSVLAAQLVVLAVTVGAAAYWWLAVVPSARRTLAKEKRQGSLNNYLLELQSNPDKKLERWFYTDWLNQLQRRQQLAAQAAAKRKLARPDTAAAAAAPAAGVSAELGGEQQHDAKAAAQAAQQQQQQQQQVPSTDAGDCVDKEPSFWSLDNPILATAAFLAIIAMVSTLFHSA